MREQVLVTIGERQVGFGAALRAMDPTLREEVLRRCEAFARHFDIRGPRPQEVIDLYAQCHLERFGEPFRVEADAGEAS